MPWRSRFAALQLTEADALREGPFAFYITAPLASPARIERVEMAYLSDGFEDLTGYGLDHLPSPDFWFSRVHPEDHARVQAAWQHLVRDGETDFVYRFQRADGEYRWFREQVRKDRHDGRVVGVVMDAHAVLPREAYLRDVLDQVPLAICRYLEDGTLKYANLRFCEAFGWQRLAGEIAPRSNWYDRLQPEARPAAAARSRALLTSGEPIEMENWHRMDEGLRLYRWRVRAITSAQPPEIEAIGTDITDQREHERMLAQAAKLATLGEMATNTAHELNQPLGAIAMTVGNLTAQLAQGSGADPDHLSAKLARIERNVARARQIIENMQIFSRAEPETLMPVPLQESVTAALGLVSDVLRLDDITVTLSLTEAPCSVHGMPVRLQQVVVNILINARDAIRARRAGDPGAPRGEIHIGLERVARRARLSISDNAGGVPEALTTRIFEPFFTTKPIGEGTGLGLAIAYGIVRDHHGTLSLENVGAGATFTIKLPLLPAEDRADVSAERAPAAPPADVSAQQAAAPAPVPAERR